MERCTSRPGEPSVFALEAAPDADERPQVAWVCSRYEYTEPGTSKNSSFDDLYVTTFQDGTWHTGPRLSRHAESMRWLSGNPAGAFLMVQESPLASGAFGKARAPHPLSVKTIEHGQAIASETLSERSLGNIVESATGAGGDIHVVYAELVGEGEGTLKYRRGSLRPADPVTSAPAPAVAP